MDDRPQVLARGDGVLGEVVLRHRTGRQQSVHELIVNGVFLMDTAETSTERLLAQTVLTRHRTPRRVLVAGLGLGCTLATLLADPRPQQVEVVEIEPLLAGWLRDGPIPEAAAALADPRVRLRIADIRAVLAQPAARPATVADPPAPAGYDAIVLDVDNGPKFLVHDRNADLYQPAALAQAAAALRPGGLLVVWSADPAPALLAALDAMVGPSDELVRQVRRQGRLLDYYLYTATRSGELPGKLAGVSPSLRQRG